MSIVLYQDHSPTGPWSKPPTPKSSPQATRQSPQTVKRSRVTASLKALPAGTVLTDKNGQHWKLGALQTKDDQGILYEGVLRAAGVVVRPGSTRAGREDGSRLPHKFLSAPGIVFSSIPRS